MKKTKITIIGKGRFGQFLSEILAKNFTGLKQTDDIADADIIFPCVPVSAFEKVIKNIAPKLKKSSLVIDVCSVKEHPAEVMLKHLPVDVDIIASHPLFGPDGAKDGLEGLPLVIWPLRIKRNKFEKIKLACEKLGLAVHVMSPEDHDKLAAMSQAYVHLIGRIGQKVGVKSTPIDTVGFRRMLAMQEVVTNDSDQLFIDMNRFNPFTKAMRQQVKKALDEIESELSYAPSLKLRRHKKSLANR